MTSALVGHSGFVGSTLKRQTFFDAHFRSTDIQDIVGQSFDLLVCAGAPAQKWKANAEPDRDRATIDSLIERLDTVTCDRFVLISTVDVFGSPVGVDEDDEVDVDGLHAYGANRRRLEQFVQQRFPASTVVRLPGLVGPGLQKNVIFDLLHDNDLEAVDARSVFQFYPMVNLWWDVRTAVAAGLDLVHLTAAPVAVGELASAAFGREFTNALERTPAHYDFRTKHAEVFGASGPYQYDVGDTILAIRAYAQSAGAVSA
ncbi:NAD(P)-dependent oxidoreductase [Nocardioides iriomotensis]|uniref:NAD(P)-dependent oxidoreductase n=1 Tax=Nocardioides iriomotensis TaxID=715784 RepID=A0A4Q5IUR5_9ACTN|nr:NAD(P)-dependent oxidoreductase [Nocardioides iriomotensis]RYU09652.1 NAD(P)-dependent oxidoreductase [Nocardioides iriomotensis]